LRPPRKNFYWKRFRSNLIRHKEYFSVQVLHNIFSSRPGKISEWISAGVPIK
jgi:hypothetical protein